MPRPDGRQKNELRPVRFTKDYTKHAEGSCLVEFGDTRVLCTASVEEDVPPFLKGSGQGWVTAEYGMLPRSTNTRIRRDKAAGSGRTLEISRLIGRSLRAVVDRAQLGERTVKVDCDVLQADGGTRTAAVTGGFVALALALEHIRQQGLLTEVPLKDTVAAVSVGVFQGEPVLDLNYDEDSQADMDMNVVMVGSGGFVEVQGTAEGAPYSRQEIDTLLELAQAGIQTLGGLQKEHVPFLK